MAAGADIVETNQVMQAVASGKPVCDGTKCVPLRVALKKQEPEDEVHGVLRVGLLRKHRRLHRRSTEGEAGAIGAWEGL